MEQTEKWNSNDGDHVQLLSMDDGGVQITFHHQPKFQSPILPLKLDVNANYTCDMSDDTEVVAVKHGIKRKWQEEDDSPSKTSVQIATPAALDSLSHETSPVTTDSSLQLTYEEPPTKIKCTRTLPLFAEEPHKTPQPQPSFYFFANDFDRLRLYD